MADKPKDAAKDASEKPKEGASEVDKDYVIFHFPGVEQLDGTSSGCETLKIPRESAIGLVKKVRPAVARLVERCPCNDPDPEPAEAMVPCVDCMAELKEEARRISTQAMVQTPISNVSLQQPCPFKPQSLTMMQNCPIPPHAPPMPDTITKQLSFIRISCGKCGAEQITDPARKSSKSGPADPKAAAAAGTSASTSGPCAGGTVNLAIPSTNSHIQFTCNCLEKQQQQQAAAGAPAPSSGPHAPACCYGRGYPAPRPQSHHERARDRLLSEERHLTQEYELEDCAVGRMSRVGSNRESYRELDERRVYGRGARGRGIDEDDDEDDDGRYAVRRTSSGSVEVIGNDNYRVRVSLGGGNRSKRSVGR